MHKAIRWAGAAIPLCPLSMGCEVLAGNKERPEVAPTKGACSEQVPTAPAGVPPDGGTNEIVVALRTLEFGAGPSEIAALGFDLDHKDTRCDAGAPALSCKVASSAFDAVPS